MRSPKITGLHALALALCASCASEVSFTTVGSHRVPYAPSVAAEQGDTPHVAVVDPAVSVDGSGEESADASTTAPTATPRTFTIMSLQLASFGDERASHDHFAGWASTMAPSKVKARASGRTISTQAVRIIND